MATPRSIVTYQEKALFITSGGAATDQTIPGSIIQLSRIQDVEMTVNYPLQQDMYLDAGSESYLPSNNSVALSIKYLHTNGVNERWLGLFDLLPPSGLPGFNLEQEKNLYITVENQNGIDAVGAVGTNQTKTVIGLGQVLMNEYQLSAQVGGIIESQVSLVGLTSFVYSGNSGNQIPTVHHQDGSQLTGLFVLPATSAQYNINGTGVSTGSTDYVSAIASNDMILTFPVNSPFAVVFTGSQSCYLQSFNCSLTFGRQEMKSMGYAFPDQRPILYPMHVDLTTEAIVSSYQADELQRISCLATGFSINLIVKQPCSNITLFGLYFSDLQMESQSFASSVGEHDTVSIHWKGIITSPIQPFFNPTVNYLVDAVTSEAWGTHW